MLLKKRWKLYNQTTKTTWSFKWHKSKWYLEGSSNPGSGVCTIKGRHIPKVNFHGEGSVLLNAWLVQMMENGQLKKSFNSATMKKIFHNNYKTQLISQIHKAENWGNRLGDRMANIKVQLRKVTSAEIN